MASRKSTPKENKEKKSNPKEQKEKKASEAKRVLKELQNAHKRAERERERIRREREREEQLRQKREEQLLRSRERQLKKEAAEREKESRRLQREEFRKQKEKEREDERQKKEEERLKREEEKRKKDEERHAKELERLKEEEEKRRKAEKQRALMMGFLVVKQDEKQEVASGTSGSSPAKEGPFMQFQLKKDQRMAPLSRVSPKLLAKKRENVEQLLQSWRSAPASSTDASRLGLHKFGQPNYIHELRTGQIRPLSSPSTWPVELPDVLFLGEGSNIPASVSLCRGHGNPGDGGTVWTKAKLFQFVENYRPAYYGTWRRRSMVINGRHPFVRDRLQLDYEVDSDDEWEEEEPGESITQSEEEEDEEVGDEDDDDDAKFLVPHGYLSDDEGVDADGGGTEEEAEGGNEPLEMKKLRQRLSLAEYETAHKRGLQKLRSLLFGPFWSPNPLDLAEPGDGSPEDNKENVALGGDGTAATAAAGACPSTSGAGHRLMQSVLSAHRMYFWDNQMPVIPKMSAPASASSSRVLGKMKKSFPDEAIPYLIQLIHKNTLSKAKLQFEFRVFWHQHTTGSAPSCTHYQEYKKRADGESQLTSTTTPDDVANQRTLRRASHLMSLESLALSKRVVLSKICEIAKFEEGRWIVRLEVLSELGQELSTTFSHQSAQEGTSTSVTGPDICFPPWSYVSDVTSFGVGNKKSQKRTSQVVAEPGTPVAKVANVVEASPSVSTTVLTPKRTPKTPKRTTKSPAATQKRPKKAAKADEETVEKPPVEVMKKTPTRKQKNPQQQKPQAEPHPTPPAVTPPTKKRVTLETFFSTPSAKRKKVVGGGDNPADAIVID